MTIKDQLRPTRNHVNPTINYFNSDLRFWGKRVIKRPKKKKKQFPDHNEKYQYKKQILSCLQDTHLSCAEGYHSTSEWVSQGTLE